MSPLVSILIPCYNAERWIAQCIESALAQTWPEKEVIVVDDGSTDGSLEIIRGFGDHIRWETGPNRGGNGARNRLLELANGEWLQYLDADDYLLPGKMAAQLESPRSSSECDVIYSPVTLEHWSGARCRTELLPIPDPHDPWILLARWYLPQTGAALWRRQAIVDVGGWREDQPCCQEHELYLRLLMAGKRFDFCAAPGAVYRQWGEHTVCKRDKRELRKRRLEIEEQAESFMRQNGQLSPARLEAINQTRFEIARVAWQDDPAVAQQIIKVIRDGQPDFVPRGVAAPPAYRWLFRLGGFRFAETIADRRRDLVSNLA